MKTLVGVLSALIAVAFTAACSGSSASEDELRTFDAERVCTEDFIAKRLKAPASAEYDVTTTGGPVTYRVAGTVDSENSFGAMLRSEVECVVSIDGDRWHLDSISIE